MRVVSMAAREVLLKLLLYGAPGSEKTRVSATAALDERTAPCLMISAVGNPLSIFDYPQKPDIIELDHYKDLSQIYSWLLRKQPASGPVYEVLKPKEPYKTIIIDGVTYLQRWAMAEATGNLDIGVGDVPTAAQQQHHGQVLTRMTMLADRFYALPMHVIMTALEYEQADASNNLYYRVQLTGQAAGELPSYAYLVGRLVHRQRVSARSVGAQLAPTLKEKLENAKDADSIMLLQPSERYYAKCQYCKPPRAIVKPTITRILNMIERAVEPESLEPVEEADEQAAAKR